MNMVERVARAIAQADERNGGPPYEYRITFGKHAKEQLFDEARAAIEAMREPICAAIHCGCSDYCNFDEAEDKISDLIDAALKE